MRFLPYSQVPTICLFYSVRTTTLDPPSSEDTRFCRFTPGATTPRVLQRIYFSHPPRAWVGIDVTEPFIFALHRVRYLRVLSWWRTLSPHKYVRMGSECGNMCQGNNIWTVVDNRCQNLRPGKHAYYCHSEKA